jgi:geranylgeranyl diphosphate synthase type II
MQNATGANMADASKPVPSAALESLMQHAAAQTERFLQRYLAELTDTPPQLTDAMAYSLFGPGKRIRPVLAVLCCQAVGGTLEAALPAAGAVELIHCFSLIHDDLPAMDDDDLRRGRPTNHKVYGDALAILAGDAMNTMAFDLLVRHAPAPLVADLVRELAWATGPEGMIGGQVLDTCHPAEAKSGAGSAGGLPHLQRIHRMKTGALIKGACHLGGLCGHATPEQLALIDTYGRSIGLAFQIVDDLLDVTATAEQLGKKTGKDAAIGKLTYPGLIGMDESRRHLAEQVRVSEQVADQLGAPAQQLAALAHWLADRSH